MTLYGELDETVFKSHYQLENVCHIVYWVLPGQTEQSWFVTIVSREDSLDQNEISLF